MKCNNCKYYNTKKCYYSSWTLYCGYRLYSFLELLPELRNYKEFFTPDCDFAEICTKFKKKTLLQKLWSKIC